MENQLAKYLKYVNWQMAAESLMASSHPILLAKLDHRWTSPAC